MGQLRLTLKSISTLHDALGKSVFKLAVLHMVDELEFWDDGVI